MTWRPLATALPFFIYCSLFYVLSKKNDETVHQLFVDFNKAYDSVRREVLYSILIEFGVPVKLVRLFPFQTENLFPDAGAHIEEYFL
jgi:hypothetical protein